MQKVSGLPLCKLWIPDPKKCSIERLDRQNRKFEPILIVAEAKIAHYLCANEGFVHQELREFVKMTPTRVSSH